MEHCQGDIYNIRSASIFLYSIITAQTSSRDHYPTSHAQAVIADSQMASLVSTADLSHCASKCVLSPVPLTTGPFCHAHHIRPNPLAPGNAFPDFPAIFRTYAHVRIDDIAGMSYRYEILSGRVAPQTTCSNGATAARIRRVAMLSTRYLYTGGGELPSWKRIDSRRFADARPLIAVCTEFVINLPIPLTANPTKRSL